VEEEEEEEEEVDATTGDASLSLCPKDPDGASASMTAKGINEKD